MGKSFTKLGVNSTQSFCDIKAQLDEACINLEVNFDQENYVEKIIGSDDVDVGGFSVRR